MREVSNFHIGEALSYERIAQEASEQRDKATD